MLFSSIWAGKTCLSRSKQSTSLKHQLKQETPAGWSSTYMLQKLLGQQKLMHDHGSKQELKKTNAPVCIHCKPYKNQNLRARFWMGGDGRIHWPTVESNARKRQTCSFNNVFLKANEVSSSTWDLHFRMSLWLKFVFSNELSMCICSEVTTTKRNLPFFRANSNWELGRGGGESGQQGEIPSGFSGMFGNYPCSCEKIA